VVAAGEAVDVADEAEHRRSDDWADAVDLGEGCLRSRDNRGETPFHLAELGIKTLQVIDQGSESRREIVNMDPAARDLPDDAGAITIRSLDVSADF
jgi:hypothetical protein